MMIMKNSMADDLKAAKDNPDSAPVAPVAQAVNGAEADAIADEYEGNRSYAMMKSQEAAPGVPAGEGEGGAIDPEYDDVNGAEDEDSDNHIADEEKPAPKIYTAAEFNKQKTAIIVLLVAIVVLGTYAYFRNKAVEEAMGDNVLIPTYDSKLFAEDFSGVTDENDIARMNDIMTIAKTAALYHIEEAADLPVSENFIKLNEENPVTDFLKRALARYGKSESLLFDPRDPGFYYTYQSSDGMGIALSARLEDLESARCAEQDPCLYGVVLTEEDIRGMDLNLQQYKQSL